MRKIGIADVKMGLLWVGLGIGAVLTAAFVALLTVVGIVVSIARYTAMPAVILFAIYCYYNGFPQF